MKFLAVAVLFLSAVSADVSHLNNIYLPPTHLKLAQKQQHISYVRAPVQEVVDNSVVENVSAEEHKHFVPNANIHSAVNNHIHTSGVLAQQVQKVANFAHHIQQAAATTAAPVSEIYVESNHFATAPIASIHAAVGQHVHKAAALAHQFNAYAQQAAEADAAVAADVQAQNVEGQLHTSGAVAHHIDNAAALAHQIKAHAQQAAAVNYAAPSSEVYQSNQKQTYYYTQENQQEDKQEEQVYEPQYTGAIAQQYSETSADVAVPQQEVQQYHYVAEHNAPAVQVYSQQQKARIYGQQSYATHSKAATGSDTQYARNGGYVY